MRVCMTGRPTKFSETLAAELLRRLMVGESLRQICVDDAMPARSTIYLWLAENPSFSDQYARAREIQADHIFDEMFDIADRDDAEGVSRDRLRIDTRKWALARMMPKKYGDKLEVEHGVTDKLSELLDNRRQRAE